MPLQRRDASNDGDARNDSDGDSLNHLQAGLLYDTIPSWDDAATDDKVSDDYDDQSLTL